MQMHRSQRNASRRLDSFLNHPNGTSSPSLACICVIRCLPSPRRHLHQQHQSISSDHVGVTGRSPTGSLWFHPSSRFSESIACHFSHSYRRLSAQSRQSRILTLIFFRQLHASCVLNSFAIMSPTSQLASVARQTPAADLACQRCAKGKVEVWEGNLELKRHVPVGVLKPSKEGHVDDSTVQQTLANMDSFTILRPS